MALVERLLDGGLETYSTIPTTTETPHTEVEQPTLSQWTISTSSPRTGSKHATITDRSGDALLWGSENIGIPGSPVDVGGLWEASCYIKASSAATAQLQVEIYKVVDGSITEGGIDSQTAFNVTTSYTQLLVDGTMPADRTHIHMRLSITTASVTYDVDDFSFKTEQEPVVLYIQNRGFRFPYQRWQ